MRDISSEIDTDMPPTARILEIKQALDIHAPPGAGRADPVGTLRMIAQMRDLLARQLDRFAATGTLDGALDGKQTIDLVNNAARTLEKIAALEREVAEAMPSPDELSPERRDALHQTVEDLILTLAARRAERMVAERLDEGAGAVAELGERSA